MMTWNYRVVRCDGQLRIHDVYYGADGRACARHVEPTFVYGESLDELRDQLSLMQEALDLSILDDHEIGGLAESPAP